MKHAPSLRIALCSRRHVKNAIYLLMLNEDRQRGTSKLNIVQSQRTMLAIEAYTVFNTSESTYEPYSPHTGHWCIFTAGGKCTAGHYVVFNQAERQQNWSLQERGRKSCPDMCRTPMMQLHSIIDERYVSTHP
jgi:hypothetical protein